MAAASGSTGATYAIFHSTATATRIGNAATRNTGCRAVAAFRFAVCISYFSGAATAAASVDSTATKITAAAIIPL
jgi:uncharacterized membrane protein YgdD (TMEM256/DUF423 family)